MATSFSDDSIKFLNTKDFPVLVGAEKLKFFDSLICRIMLACTGVYFLSYVSKRYSP